MKIIIYLSYWKYSLKRKNKLISRFRSPSIKRQNRESYLGNDYPARDTEAVQVDREGMERKSKKCEKLNTWIENFFFWLPIPFILQAECQNHIRIVAKLSKEVLLVCGTHAYKPKCRHYAFKVSSSAARERRPKTTTTHALESSSRQEFSNCRFLHFAIPTKIEAFRTRALAHIVWKSPKNVSLEFFKFGIFYQLCDELLVHSKYNRSSLRSQCWMRLFCDFKHCELLLYCSSCEILKEKSQPFYSRNVK